jgi:hypothetical protein
MKWLVGMEAVMVRTCLVFAFIGQLKLSVGCRYERERE